LRTTDDDESDDETEGDDQDEFGDPYFTAAERKRLRRWRAICAQRPALTRDQIESVGALLRTMDQRRSAERSKK
jgi:hypothetical protein